MECGRRQLLANGLLHTDITAAASGEQRGGVFLKTKKVECVGLAVDYQQLQFRYGSGDLFAFAVHRCLKEDGDSVAPLCVST